MIVEKTMKAETCQAEKGHAKGKKNKKSSKMEHAEYRIH